MAKVIEKHVTIDEDTYNLLNETSIKEGRTMRGTWRLLINAHAKKVGK